MISCLPTELFSVIASHIPLFNVTPTLSALSSANRQTHAIVQPLIYVRLVLRNEDVALKVIRKILDDPKLGTLIREFYVMSELSTATRRGEREFDVITGIKQVIEKTLLPHIHSLGIYMLPGWNKDENYQDVIGYGHLSAEFWQHIRNGCPRLRTLILRDVQDSDYDPWLDDSVIDGINVLKDLSDLHLFLRIRSARGDGSNKFTNNVVHLASSLRSLTLAIRGNGIIDAEMIFVLHFPNLQVLELYGFACGDSAEVTPFWNQHPKLERLVLDSSEDRWFGDTISPGLLPNLVHLKVENYATARALAPILDQLISLSISESYNLQIPYLLRSVLPDGLPRLRSLDIGQTPTSDRDFCRAEGSMWYETQNGKFIEEKKIRKAFKSMTDNYMPSILKAAPNLEELGLQGVTYSPDNLVKVFGPVLVDFKRLKRLYFKGYCFEPSDYTTENISDLLESVRPLAQSCPHLVSVTDFSPRTLPYVTAKIVRGPGGNVEDVVSRTGFGMEIGREDDPFPRNRRF